MVDQTTMNSSNGISGPSESRTSALERSSRAVAAANPSPSPAQVASNVAGFGENVLNMGELQARMAAIELRQNVDALRIVTIVGLVGAILALASLPIVLAGLAELLVTELGFRRGPAFLTVGFASLIVGAVTIVSAALWIRTKRLGFPLSAEEFTRNLAWIRTTLRLSGRPAKGRL
jgi:hypothetical protein